MTAIVYDHKKKQVAVDSRCCSGGDIMSDEYDKVIIKDREVWIYSGYTCDSEEFSNLKHGDKTEIKEKINAFIIKDGFCFYAGIYDGYMHIDKRTSNDHLGSGGYFAYCALDFDNTAEEAVKYAIKKDCYSGGKVRVFNLDGEEVK